MMGATPPFGHRLKIGGAEHLAEKANLNTGDLIFIRSLRLSVWPAGHTPRTARRFALQVPLCAFSPSLGRGKLLSTLVLIRAF